MRQKAQNMQSWMKRVFLPPRAMIQSSGIIWSTYHQSSWTSALHRTKTCEISPELPRWSRAAVPYHLRSIIVINLYFPKNEYMRQNPRTCNVEKEEFSLPPPPHDPEQRFHIRHKKSQSMQSLKKKEIFFFLFLSPLPWSRAAVTKIIYLSSNHNLS